MQDRTEESVAAVLERTCRSESAWIVAVLLRILGSIEEAEDVLQSACTRALESWPRRGLPSNPGAWLTTVAKRIAIDTLRRNRRQMRLNDRIAVTATGGPDPYELLARWPDERLRLVFLCCRPELDRSSRLALTLKEVCGLRVEEISAAFLTKPTTMAQRLVRAKRRLRERKIVLTELEAATIPDRIGDVLTVIYLLFNQGYLPAGGNSLVASELCEHAIHLARMLVEILEKRGVPEHPETLALLSLMLFIHARREARVDDEGLPVLLEAQDRNLWRRQESREALALLGRLTVDNDAGPFAILAAINAIHLRAPRPEDTNWQQIAALYSRLYHLQPTPVVRLNGVVALGMWQGPEAALRELDRLPETDQLQLKEYTYLYMAKARFLKDAGRPAEALRELERAAGLSGNEAERRFIERRIEEVADP